MSWLSKLTGVHMDLRPLAPIAGAVVGNMLLPGIGGAALGSGLSRFLDGTAHHESFGDAAKAGAITGGVTYAGGKALEGLRGMFSPSSAGVAAPAGAPSGYAAEGGGLNVGIKPPMVNPSDAGSSMFASAAKSAGSFAKENPMAVSMGLQGLGSIAQSGAQNELARAQAHRLDLANEDDDYELKRKKARDAALEPIRQALAGQLSSLRANRYGIAPNPYTGV